MDSQSPPLTRVKIIAVKPAYHSEVCPVCHGFGSLKWGTKPCQACRALGYILVPNFVLDGRTEYGGLKK